jgi:hypothetical protein
MSGSQPEHVRPNSIPQHLSPGPDISAPQAGFQSSWPDMSGPRPRHVWVSDTPMARFSWGAIKGPPRLSSTVGHLFHIATIWDTLLSSQPLSSKLPRRDLRLTLEWLTRSSSQALHRWSPCVHYSCGFVPIDGLGCLGVTKVGVDLRKFVLPSPLWGFDSGNWTRSWWSFGLD